MSFHNVRFPVEIGQGSRAGAGFKTRVTKLDSGGEGRVGFWSAAHHQFDVSYGIRSLEDLSEVKTFYMARQGALHTFRFRDPTDWTSNSTNPTHTAAPGTRDQQCVPPTGDGTRTSFQLAKRYVSGAVTHVRTIVLPVSGSIDIWINGVLKTEGADYTIDYSTGEVVTSVAVTAGHAVEWSGEFDVKCRFGESADEILGARVDGYDLGNIPSIDVIEVDEDDGAHVDEFMYGGSSEQVMSASFVMDGGAFLWVLNPSTTGLYARLPDPAGYPTGGFHFCIKNAHGSNSFTVKNEGGTTLVTLTAGKSCLIGLTVESDQTTKTWYAFGG